MRVSVFIHYVHVTSLSSLSHRHATIGIMCHLLRPPKLVLNLEKPKSSGLHRPKLLEANRSQASKRSIYVIHIVVVPLQRDTEKWHCNGRG